MVFYLAQQKINLSHDADNPAKATTPLRAKSL